MKPGTMVEWGNYWSKAIKLRDYQHTEAYMGCFSQIGELYNVKVRTEGYDRASVHLEASDWPNVISPLNVPYLYDLKKDQKNFGGL